MNDSQSERFLEGMEVRRAVLGEEYVAAATSSARRPNAALQQLVTEYCWGAIWTRPELDRKIRSLVNLGILTALNRPRELRIHLEGAMRTGASIDEIYEVLLQTAAYCGVPAAIDAFKVADSVFAKVDWDSAEVKVD